MLRPFFSALTVQLIGVSSRGHYTEMIRKFSQQYRAIANFSVIPKQHCLEVHVEEFLTLKGEGDKGLSWYSEQAYEAVHHHFNLEEERTRLQPDHPNFRENLLRTVLRFNGKNI